MRSRISIFVAVLTAGAFTLTACSSGSDGSASGTLAASLTQEQFVEQTKAAGFEVPDPPKAYNTAKIMCAGKDKPDFHSAVENLARLATMDKPKTQQQYDAYVGIVSHVC